MEIEVITLENLDMDKLLEMSVMYRNFYKEVFGSASSRLDLFSYKISKFAEDDNYILVYAKGIGFGVILKVVDILKEVPENIYEGLVVYVKPKFRFTKAYKRLLDFADELTKDGKFYLAVYKHLQNYKIIKKRHNEVMSVFEYRR